MNELFGLSMTYIASVCLAVTAAILLLIAWIAVRNPVMFKMGLRNIPRRKAQTTLIILGLMLSTLIMTSAFGTGDTLTTSISAEVFEALGEADEIIEYDTEEFPASADQQVIPLEFVDALRARFVNDPDIEAVVPFSFEAVPVFNQRTRLNEAQASVTAVRKADAAAFGGLKDTAGRPVDLALDEIAINEDLADEIDARAGDRVLLLYQGKPIDMKVRAIVPTNVLGGVGPTVDKAGAVSWEFLTGLTGKTTTADAIIVSNRGGPKAGLDRADAAQAKLEEALAGSPYKSTEYKQDGVRQAEFFGNVFTTFFVVLGLFSIAAGVLLIFLIFIMLAAERKPEMGMARAVGAKRRQIVESFLAEGMGYDLGSAAVGLVAGIGVTFAMIAIIKATMSEFGLNLVVSFKPRSLVTALCLGIITTFIVIFVSSWRASRLNIVAAIRDLPEASSPNPEAATARGYVRAALNGFVAFGALIVSLLLLFAVPAAAPLWAIGILSGLVGPWVYVLMGHNFGAPKALRRSGERAPGWPVWLGIATLVLGVGLLVLLGYFLAMLLVRLTRDRKPTGMPLWLVVLGIALPPLGLVIAALQDSSRRVAWGAGFGTVSAVTGVAMVAWGLDANSEFLFAGGVSLVLFWVAVAMRYFHYAERLSFTLTGAALLAFWYLAPSGRLDRFTGELNGDIEMFFLSGLVMVTAGVFVVVYNADITLPALAAFGSRAGRVVPALKTAVAYPLTSRFRTGMTIAMTGLIMFALVVTATLNTNFAAVFLNKESKGGFDVRLVANTNNLIDDIGGALASTGADTSRVTAIGTTRWALPFEAEVENRDRKKADNGKVNDFDRYMVAGADAGFLAATTLPMKFRAAGYATDEDVWRALRENPGLAVLPAAITAPADGFGPPVPERLVRLNPLSEGFQPFTLGLRDPGTGTVTNVTVIGQMKERADVFYWGIIVRLDTVAAAYPDSRYQAFYLALRPGTDAEAYAKTIEAGLVQASAESLDKLLDEQQQMQMSFMLVFQGFMGLGLIVGIAALGVVASRAVVERRQQIGMLRAIGYKRGMVALSFLFESGFIAVTGIMLGLTLGVSFAWVLFTSGNVGDESLGASFRVPWLNLGIVAGLALGASLLTTVLPARSASRVAVAEALRYE